MKYVELADEEKLKMSSACIRNACRVPGVRHSECAAADRIGRRSRGFGQAKRGSERSERSSSPPTLGIYKGAGGVAPPVSKWSDARAEWWFFGCRPVIATERRLVGAGPLLSCGSAPADGGVVA